MALIIAFLILRLLLCLDFISGDAYIHPLNFEAHLRVKLFNNWTEMDAQTLPSSSNNRLVYFDINITHIKHLDEFKQILTTNAVIKMKWKNPKYQWNRTAYGNIQSITLGTEYMWHPDIYLYNSVSGTEMLKYGPGLARIYYNGIIEWQPQITLRSRCSLDLSNFPFDEQECTLKFASWTLKREELDLKLEAGNGTTKEVVERSKRSFHEWSVIDAAITEGMVVRPCCTTPVPNINLYLRFRRHSTFHMYTLIIPLGMTMIVMLVMFLLPPSANEKFALGGINLLILVILLNQLYWVIPRNKAGAPIAVAVAGTTYFFMTLSVIISIAMTNLSQRSGVSPALVERYLRGPLGSVLFLPAIPVQMEESSDADLKNHWSLLAIAINRICFVVYLIIVIILFILLFA